MTKRLTDEQRDLCEALLPIAIRTASPWIRSLPWLECVIRSAAIDAAIDAARSGLGGDLSGLTAYLTRRKIRRDVARSCLRRSRLAFEAGPLDEIRDPSADVQSAVDARIDLPIVLASQGLTLDDVKDLKPKRPQSLWLRRKAAFLRSQRHEPQPQAPTP